MYPVLCTRGALAAVAMAFAGAAFAGGPGINLPAPALQEGFSIHGLIDTGFQIHHANSTTSARMMPNGDVSLGLSTCVPVKTSTAATTSV